MHIRSSDGLLRGLGQGFERYLNMPPTDLLPFFEKPFSEVLDYMIPEIVAHEVGVPAGSWALPRRAVHRGSDSLMP